MKTSTIAALFFVAIGSTDAASIEDFPYAQPVWYDEVFAEATARGENMKRCFKRTFGPHENGSCADRPKVCFFGTQECGVAPDLQPRPWAKCSCTGLPSKTWTCEYSPCPNPLPPVPPAPLVDPFPLLNGTGSLIAPSPTAQTTLANVATAIQATIVDKPDLAASYVRLGFHDCSPNFPGGGGCDGCVNMAMEPDPVTGILGPIAFSNNGVDKAVYPLEPIWNAHQTTEVSRADIWAYATLVAANFSQSPSNAVDFLDGFQVGRRNCEDRGLCNGGSTDPAFCALNGMEKEEELTGADIDFHELMEWMDFHFQFSNDEVVALMGAHTLGRVNRNNSGYDGLWVENNTVLDNDYYKLLIGGGLETGPDYRSLNILPDEVFSSDTEFQFIQDKMVPRPEGTGIGDVNLMMLNVDVALVRDLSGGYVLSEHAYKYCSYKNPVRTRCPLAPTMGKAEEYSNDELLWKTDFKAVVSKMLSKNP